MQARMTAYGQATRYGQSARSLPCRIPHAATIALRNVERSLAFPFQAGALVAPSTRGSFGRAQRLARFVAQVQPKFRKQEEHLMAMNTSVMGIYPDRTTVSDANVLHKAGYRTTDISVLSADNEGSKDFGHEKHTRAPEGAAMGAAVGAVIAGALA